jgi:hypothetical protein
MSSRRPASFRSSLRVLDYVDSALAAVERYRPPSVIARTLIYDGLSMLDDFAKEYRGYVGRVMDYVCDGATKPTLRGH